MLLDPPGAPMRYSPLGNGRFAAPAADFATLAQLADGRYTHTNQYGLVREFNAQDLQTARIDRNGNRTTYEYAAQRLSRIIDPVGQITHFT